MAQIREESGLATARVCDLTSEGSQRKVFHAHCEEHGTLDLCLLNAGIAEQGQAIRAQTSLLQLLLECLQRMWLSMTKFPCFRAIRAMYIAGDLFDPDNDEWSRVIQVNLISVLAGIRIAVHFMKSLGSKGQSLDLHILLPLQGCSGVLIRDGEGL